MNNNIGPLIRVFEGNRDNIKDRIKKTESLINKLSDADIGNIQILIPEEKDKVDMESILKDAFYTQNRYKDIISNITSVKGNQFTDVLNYGIEQNIKAKIDNSFIVSPEIGEHINKFNISLLENALKNKKIGVSSMVISDSQFGGKLEQASKEGRFSNTFCLRDTQLLYDLGMFGEEGIHGVEEIGPLVKMIEKGYKTAPIILSDKIEYSMVDGSNEHQDFKFRSKLIRQTNAYLLLLKNRGDISEGMFKSTYVTKLNDGTFTNPENPGIRNDFEKKLKEILLNGVDKDYRFDK